jgi:6-phosphofructokinase
VCSDLLATLTNKETRHVVLGHLQRGGQPTAFDRTLATRFGGKAVELLQRGQFGKMVANHPPDIVPISIGEVVGKTKTVPLDYDSRCLIPLARSASRSRLIRRAWGRRAWHICRSPACYRGVDHTGDAPGEGRNA